MIRKRKCDEEEAPDIITKRTREINSNEVDPSIRGGKILKMQLINFMCHSNLVLDLNLQSNLIVGVNGSGKSAIITALVLGLGSKARDTSRSTNVKNLVKHGEHSASITIELANNGEKPYKHDIFGDKIIISRYFSTKGAYSYTIKNQSGRIVAKSWNELNAILFHFKIMPDNPVFVLNQDNARAFLKDVNPLKFYKFFIKATNIEYMLEQLDFYNNSEEYYMLRYQTYLRDYNKLAEEVQQLNDKYNELQSLESIQSTIASYKKEILWNRVIQQEAAIEAIQNEIRSLNDNIKLFRKRVYRRNEIRKECEAEIREYDKKLAEHHTLLEIENKKLNGLKEDLSREFQKCEIEQQQFKKLQNSLKALQSQMADLQTHINERSELLDSSTKLQEQNAKRKVELEKQIEELRAMISTTKRDLGALSETRLQFEEQLREMNTKKKEKSNQIEFMKSKLHRIQSSVSDNLSVYGRDMSSFLKEIESAYNNGLFQNLPRGPLGRYIKIPDEKWRATIEHLLGGLIRSFIVSCTADRLQLDKIRQRFPQIRITLLTTKFQKTVYDVKKGMVSVINGTKLLMNEISCSDPVVMNTLIDRVKIEAVLLTEHKELARKLTVDQQNVPPNLNRVILLKPCIEYRPAPRHKTYALNVQMARYVEPDMAQTINHYTNEIKKESVIERNLQEAISEMSSRLSKTFVNIDNLKRTLQNHEINYQNKNAELQEVMEIELPTETEMEYLIKEQKQINEKIDSITNELKKREMSMREYKQLNDNTKKAVDDLTNKLQHIQHEISTLKNQRDDQGEKLLSLETNSLREEAKLNKSEQDVKCLEEKLEKAFELLQTLVERAQALGERMKSEKTEEELNAAIKKLEQTITRIITCGTSVDAVKALLDKKRKKANHDKRTVNFIRDSLKTVKTLKVISENKLQNHKTYMSVKLRAVFETILKIQKFSGSIKINHEEQSLKIFVVPKDKNKNVPTNLKSLSGGERSFTTVAFLLSLWACVDHPFYFLDEYDVFTDEFNRRVMTDLLLSEAKKKPHRQFVFLTPQILPFVTKSHNLSIFRMNDHRC